MSFAPHPPPSALRLCSLQIPAPPTPGGCKDPNFYNSLQFFNVLPIQRNCRRRRFNAALHAAVGAVEEQDARLEGQVVTEDVGVGAADVVLRGAAA